VRLADRTRRETIELYQLQGRHVVSRNRPERRSATQIQFASRCRSSVQCCHFEPVVASHSGVGVNPIQVFDRNWRASAA
jgi:hypothetical protein